MKKITNAKFLAALRCRAETKSQAGHYSTARNYRRTLSSFSAYLTQEHVEKSRCFNASVVRGYARWLEGRGCLRNTVSFYMRILRAAWASAGGGMDTFSDVFTGVEQTRKRALNTTVIRDLYNLEIDGRLALTRDLFVFSFAARGMAFVDMAFLQWTDIISGYVRYVRHKTGRPMSVRLEPFMQEIIDRWRAVGSPFVFPVLSSSPGSKKAFLQYETGLRTYNRGLKEIAGMVGCPHLSSYYARHTWASAARFLGVPLPVISEGMGHTSERTTKIYLDSFDESVVDKANASVLGSMGLC